MIAAITTVKDEEDIIDCTVRHMLDQGVDHVWVMDWFSTDGTREILAEIEAVTVVDGSPLPFYWTHHGFYMERLAALSCADWIVPFDADEYWTGTHGRTVAQALNECIMSQVLAEIWQYVDFDHHQLRPYPWRKVAFRYQPTIRIMAGNHGIFSDEPSDLDALHVHELKFRGFDHFVRKVTRRIPWSPDGLCPPGLTAPQLAVAGGEHISADTSLEDLRSVWLYLNDQVEECSIPSEFRPCV